MVIGIQVGIFRNFTKRYLLVYTRNLLKPVFILTEGKGITKKQAQETSNANWIKFSLEEKKSIVKKTCVFSSETKTTNVIKLWVYKEY